MEIEKGHFGDVSLDGLRVVSAFSWPGPIHEGGGRAFPVIDERADEAQRKALLTILSGEETSPGATIWNVFAATLDEVVEPAFKPISIEIDIDGRTSRIKIEGFADVTGEPIRNPVTGAEHRAQIRLEDGFEYLVAEMGSGTSTVEGPIPLKFESSYGQFNTIHMDNNGQIRQ
jgi:hypothetical protein